MGSAPRAVVIILAAWAALVGAFLITGPWVMGGVAVRQLEVPLGVGIFALALLLFSERVRHWFAALLAGDVRLSRRALWIAVTIVFVALLRILMSKFLALEVNAWDFSVGFDRPLARTLSGRILYCEELRVSMLGVHPFWILFAFVPLYAIVASPLWLVLLQALAVAAAVAAAFVLFRHLSGDDFVAATLAVAFLLNRYTAKAAQYVFHPEIFYPVGLFLLFYAFYRRRPLLFVISLLFVASIKEDAILPVMGFALTAAFVHRRWRWAAAALGIVAAVFALDMFLVIPHFTQTATPFYAKYWHSYGDSLASVVIGLLTSPLQVLGRLLTGSRDLFVSLAFTPLLAPELLLAAIPALVVYTSSDVDKVHWLTMYYATPVLPMIFTSIPFSLERIARRASTDRGRRVTKRVAALVVLLSCLAVGAGYTMYDAHPDRAAVKSLLSQTESRVWVQGALFPHAGYDERVHVLNERADINGQDAFLICASCDPYPYSREELAKLIQKLQVHGRYAERRAGAISLYGAPETVGSRQ